MRWSSKRVMTSVWQTCLTFWLQYSNINWRLELRKSSKFLNGRFCIDNVHCLRAVIKHLPSLLDWEDRSPGGSSTGTLFEPWEPCWREYWGSDGDEAHQNFATYSSGIYCSLNSTKNCGDAAFDEYCPNTNQSISQKRAPQKRGRAPCQPVMTMSEPHDFLVF